MPLLYSFHCNVTFANIIVLWSSCWLVFLYLVSLFSECARLFHEGGARLVLCGPSWDKLESLHDSLCSGSDPSTVSMHLQQNLQVKNHKVENPSTGLSHIYFNCIVLIVSVCLNVFPLSWTMAGYPLWQLCVHESHSNVIPQSHRTKKSQKRSLW